MIPVLAVDPMIMYALEDKHIGAESVDEHGIGMNTISKTKERHQALLFFVKHKKNLAKQNTYNNIKDKSYSLEKSGT